LGSTVQSAPRQGRREEGQAEAKKAEKAAKAKAEKKAGKDAQKKAADDAKAPVSNRGRGIARDRGVASITDDSKTTENETDTDSTEASGDGAETSTRGKGANPLPEQFKREFLQDRPEAARETLRSIAVSRSMRSVVFGRRSEITGSGKRGMQLRTSA